MNLVMDAVVEHIAIDFPSREAVKEVYASTAGTEDPWRRALVDEVVERRSGAELLEVLDVVECAGFHREIMFALVVQRERSGRAVGLLRCPGRYHIVS